jgi:hypothetical protein
MRRNQTNVCGFTARGVPEFANRNLPTGIC